MVKGRLLLLAGAIAAVGMTASISADYLQGARKTMYLTFSQPIALPGVTLGAGSYIFELRDPVDHWRVVEVLSRDRAHSYFSGRTNLVERPDGMTRDHVITFGEVPKGNAQPIQTWWPYNEAMGREFVRK